MKVKGITDKQEAKEKKLGEAPGEVFAAIAMAMHEMQSDVHDVEETVPRFIPCVKLPTKSKSPIKR